MTSKSGFSSFFSSGTCAYWGLFAFCGFVWGMRIRNIDLEIAWKGWSPIVYVYKAFYPENLARDFPGGVQQFDTSAFMQTYKIAYLYLGISPESLLPVIIAVEFMLMILAVFCLMRTVFPDVSPVVSVIAVMLVVSSWARDIDLGRFGKPIFSGLFYDVADAFRIFAIAGALKNRYFLCGLFLAASFVTHPMMGLLGAAFVICMFAVEPRRMLERKVIVAGMVFLAIVAVWTMLGVNPAVRTVQGFPPEEWVRLTKFMSFHWYPVSYGIFTTEHQAHFLPFLSFLLLVTYYMGCSPSWRAVDRRLAAGCVGMGILMVIGILGSALAPFPLLIKLALHRAGLLIATIGLLYVTHGLWLELDSGAKWRRIVAVFVLISPFIARPGFPILFSMLLVIPSAIALTRREFMPRDVLVGALASGVILLIGIYVATGLAGPWISDAYTGIMSLRRLGASYGGLGLVTAATVFLLLGRPSARIVPLAVVAVVAMAAVLWVLGQRMSGENIRLRHAYKQTQLWARANTPSDSQFMPDPTIYYGWRDYSRRSSFGNLREWLYSGWAYTSDPQVYREGLKRFDEFSIDLDRYLRAPDAFDRLQGYFRLSNDLQHQYYSADDEWRLRLARRYGIQYFILRKDKIVKPSNLRVAYENDRFKVLEPVLVDASKKT